MKFFIISFFLTSQVFGARLCEVYGISDSPQALDCSFSSEKLDLRCRNGIYFLGNEAVDGAYHMEVEEGPTPLAFRTKTGEMIVVLEGESTHPATLARGRKKIKGNCRLPEKSPKD